MAKKAYIGINNVAKSIKKIYIGVNNQPKKVKKAYIGVNGVPKQFWPSIMEYTYSGTSSFEGEPAGNWILYLKGSGTLVFNSLPTAIDIHVVGAGGSPSSPWGFSGAANYGGGGASEGSGIIIIRNAR